MATIQLPYDFKEFLRLLNSSGVEYLLVGGFAVSFHGYPRATADMGIWIAVSQTNAEKLVQAVYDFGFRSDELSPGLFLESDRIVRLGQPPIRIEVLTSISGVAFAGCYENRVKAQIDGVDVNVIGLADLLTNKRTSARAKDLADLEQLSWDPDGIRGP